MPEPLLSTALIVRDEAEHLGACLESVAPVVDEIVVVDTGSVDESIAIARSFGARVIEEPWSDDFAHARNAALAQVTGRWVLYIDADERLRPVARRDVERLLEGADEVAFRVWLRPFVGANPCREYRLWRHDPRVRFDGVIHEKVVPSLQAIAVSDRRPIGLCDLEIDHVGYERDQSAKHRRNLPLLRAQLAREPGNVFNWRHLATVLAGLGDDAGAADALDRAVTLVRASDPPVAGGSLAYADLARRSPPEDAGRLADEGLARYPDDPLLLWTKIVVQLGADDPAATLETVDRLLAVDRARLDDTVAYDERLFDELPNAARAVCRFRLHRPGDPAPS